MLEFRNVSKSFTGAQGEVLAVREVSLSVARGEFVAVRGPSGCGKTTLLLLAGALLRPSEGEVSVDGQNPYRLAPSSRSGLRAEKIGFVFQTFHLVSYLSVFDNVILPSLARVSPEAHDRARKLIRRFNLEDRLYHIPSRLSTGECQRTALARAILNRPKLLLADEPTGNLDEKNSEIVLRVLRDFANEGGSVLLVTHNRGAAASADRILGMDKGEISTN